MKTVLIIVLTLWTAGLARAATDTATDSGLAVTGTLGAGTPVGVTGLELEARLASWISLGTGIGIGVSSVDPQLAAMARFGIPLGDATTMRVGLGLSGGGYKWAEHPVNVCINLFGSCPNDTRTWDVAYWANGELGIEFHFGTSRLSGRPFVGFSHILNSNACVEGECNVAGQWLIYTGFSLVRAF
jgi:hypothetical protein